MSETEQRVENRVPIALRIKLRYRKVDTFVSKFATNISANGMFISSRKPKDKGTLLRFELRLADDSTVISGQGKVAWVRAYDPQHPKRPHGMGIEFTTLSQESRDLISQIVRLRLEQGLGEGDEIPFAARRRSKSTAASTGAPAAEAPTPPSASAPEQALPGELEKMDVDIAAAVARARALVGSVELGEELEKLYRVSAAPVAETVDEASNNLARMLGGAAVQAKRLRHADPPTGVEIKAAAPAEDDVDDPLVAPPAATPIPEEAAQAEEAESEALPPNEVAGQEAAALDAVAELDAEQPTAIADPGAAALAAIAELDAEPEPGGPRHARAETQAVLEEDIVEAASEAPTGGQSEVHYKRAETDGSPEIIDEFNDSDASSTLVADASDALRQVAAAPDRSELDEVEDLPEIESEPPAPAASSPEAPMHLEDETEESLDIDIDEETPAPELVDVSGRDMSAAAAIDLGAIDTSGAGSEGGDDFSDSTGNTMDLTDLIELPPNMEEMDEIDIDLD